MEEKKARIDYLEDKLSMVCQLMKFVKDESDYSDFDDLMTEVEEYRMLVKMQVEIFAEIKQLHKSIGDLLMK